MQGAGLKPGQVPKYKCVLKHMKPELIFNGAAYGPWGDQGFLLLFHYALHINGVMQQGVARVSLL